MAKEAMSSELIDAFNAAMVRLAEDLVYAYECGDNAFEVWSYFPKWTASFIRVRLKGCELLVSSTFGSIDKIKRLFVFPLYNAVLVKICDICNVEVAEEGNIVLRKELPVDNIEEENIADSVLEAVLSVITANTMFELLVAIDDAVRGQDTACCAKEE